ncbi:MAG: alpha-N-arabinofuranosidase, partial [Acidobacteriaceae bacterium]|nr:alpha-N-arabinofuranosidase [Acidobacteriaceae bacterium]
YTVPNGWPPSTKSEKFGVDDYVKSLRSTLFMDEFLRKQEAVMDKYDPEKKVALVVDEWGAWHAPLAGSNPAFLVQQNSIRDAILASLNLNIFARHADRVRMANIAQMINVLQGMILTDKARMVLTPTYHVFKMYVPLQDSTLIPVAFDGGAYTRGDVTLPRLDAMAAKGRDGKLLVEITNLDAENSASIDARMTGVAVKSATAETLTAPAVDSVNTFDAPNTVVPKPTAVKLQNNEISLTVEPRSVTVISAVQ